MELCEATSSINFAFSSNGLPNEEGEEEEEDDDKESQTSSTELAALLPESSEIDMCLNGFGKKTSFPNGISTAIKKLNNPQLVVSAKQGKSSDVIAKQNKYYPLNGSGNVAMSINSSSEESCLPDAMNQYLEDEFYLERNGHESSNGDTCHSVNGNGSIDSFLSQDKTNSCIVALDVPNCSYVHSSVSHRNINARNIHETELHKRLHPMSSYQNFDTECGLARNESCCHEAKCCALPAQEHSSRSGMISPDMDFLDFDFDPGPSGDETHGAESDNSSDEGCAPSPTMDCNSLVQAIGNNLGEPSNPPQQCAGHSLSCPNLVSSPKYQNCLMSSDCSNVEPLLNIEDKLSDNSDSDSTNMEACEDWVSQRDNSLVNISNEEMDCEEVNLQSALLNSLRTLTKSVGDKQASFSSDETIVSGAVDDLNAADDTFQEKFMIWSELEACNRQVTQIGTSACGATAVINVLMAMDFSFDKEVVEKHIQTRLRAETAHISKYLISRSVAGTTHEDLIDCIHKLTDGLIYGQFFHFYPKRNYNIRKWLASWIKKGAVPLATLNLQCGVPSGQSIPDAWHHQMIFGLGPKGVYLTNPLECVPVQQIEKQLCSDSVLLVRRNDILSRWWDNCNFGLLLTHEDARWRTMNVLGQVINILRESTVPWVPGYRRHLTSHVKIPAAYKSGVTIFVHKKSEAYDELIRSKET